MKYRLLFLLIIIIAVLRAYYRDYTNLKKEFQFSFKDLLKKIIEPLVIIILFFGIKTAYEKFIPLNKEDGIEYNWKREKLGIPTITTVWKIDKLMSNQFVTYWLKPDTKNGHFKKEIEYGILNAKYETDFYQNEKRKGTFTWSNYDYGNNTFNYFIQKPNEKQFPVSQSGNLKTEKMTMVMKITKSEFEMYKVE